MAVLPVVEEPVLLSVRQAATRYGLSQAYIRDLVHAGELPRVLIGSVRWRVPLAALEAFVASRTVRAAR